MSWHEKYLSKNKKKKTLSTQNDLFTLFEEVWREQKSKLTEQQRSILSEDFFQNTLFEIFSGIDYSSMYNREVLHENKSWQDLIQEQEDEPFIFASVSKIHQQICTSKNDLEKCSIRFSIAKVRNYDIL